VKKINLGCLIIILALSLYGKKVDGINIDKSVNFAGKTMLLQGAGVRSKFIFDIYVGALYLAHSTNNPKQIIQANYPMDIKMIITSSLVSASKMKEGFNNDFKSMQNIGYKVEKKLLKKFLDTFNTKIHKGDTFDFVYLPEDKIIIYKNGLKINSIKSFDFKKSLFAIWLSSRPAQKSLKKKMLGYR